MSENLTLQDLEKFLQSPALNDDLTGYLDAAAVLAAFDLFELHPVGGDPPCTSREWLIDELLPLAEQFTQGPDRGLWSLTLPHRRTALRAMATRQKMKAALEANPARRMTALQQMWERVLGASPISVESLSREELAALSTVSEWVEDILDGLPGPAAILKAIRKADLLAPMRRLAEGGFVGRENELAQLSQYVFGEKPAAPLFVFGSGGVGKSTLLARFILRHAVPQKAAIVYIDLDRPTVRPDVPLTLLLDLVNQVRGQVDTPASMVDSVMKEITFAMSRVEGGRALESFSPNAALDPYIGQRLQGWLEDRTMLLIVDTLEEAQFLGSDVMQPLMDFLADFDHSMPGMRLILSGRALPAEFVQRVFPDISSAVAAGSDITESLQQLPLPTRPVNLAVLEMEPARELLRISLQQDGLPQLEQAELDEVIGLVSRNPMCLKLAARLLRDEGVEKLRTRHSEFLSKLKAEKIQALLYGRILGHIHDDDVRKLAYPGLIVRRLDADVIREVLAEPCGLDLKMRSEYTILGELAKEAALVEMDPTDSSLRHRADVRRAMLEDLLEHVEQATVDAIDNAAIAFYKKREGGIARAEELYHRLRQCEAQSVLDERWSPDAAIHLQTALDELPAAQRLWLAERLGVTLDESVRQAANQDAWERQAARSVERYLRSGSPELALSILHERSERSPRSALYSLEAETHRFLKQYDDALRVARAGVESATHAGAIDMALDLLLLMVVIEEVQGHLEAAEKLLQEASAVASHSVNRILQLRVQITGLRLQRALRPAARQERAVLRTSAISQLTDEMLHKLRSYPVLLREVAAELAKQDARIAATAIETLGVEVGTDAQAQALGQAIATLNAASPESPDPTLAKGAEHFEKVNYDPHAIRTWVTQVMTSKDTRKLGGTIAEAEVGTKMLSGFREYFRAGVDNALRGIGRFGES